MADLSFHHGTRVLESQETPVLLRTAQSAVVAIIGVAPDADATVWPLNTPVLIKGPAEMRLVRKLGAAGNLPAGFDAVFDQVGTYCYGIRVAEGQSLAETLSNLVGSAASLTGVHALKKCEGLYGRHLKPRIVCVPGYTGSLSTSGIASYALTNSGGAGYVEAPAVTVTPEDGNTPTIPARIRAVIGTTGDNAGKVTALVIEQPGEGYTDDGDGPTITIGAAPQGGTTATGTITVGTVANPVVAELPGILEKLRAIAFVDGPDTTDAAAVAWRATINSDRIYPIDPRVLIWDTGLSAWVPAPSSPRFAGVQAKVDRSQGFWWSVSNKPINGIGGVTRPIAYGDPSNYLNEAHVNTVINLGGGPITWGNRVATDIDLNKFLSVRRTQDFINEAIEAAYVEFNDKPFSKANLKLMIESGNAFMRTLKAEGAILGGRVWLDADLNEAAEMAQGRVTLSVEFEPPAPMEDIRIIQHRNIVYYTVLLDEVLEEMNDGPLAIPV